MESEVITAEQAQEMFDKVIFEKIKSWSEWGWYSLEVRDIPVRLIKKLQDLGYKVVEKRNLFGRVKSYIISW